jgi:hypothetical protein
MLRFLLDVGPSSPAVMGRRFGVNTAMAAYHATKLVEYDCAELVEERKVRNITEHIYRATDRHLVESRDWHNVSQLFADSLLSEITQFIVDDIAASLNARMLGSDDRFHLCRTPVSLDAEGRDEVLEILERTRGEVSEAQARAAVRMSQSGEEPHAFSSSALFFETPGFT